jgi:hypothetical protein
MFMRFPMSARTLTITLIVLYAIVSVLAGACQGDGTPFTMEHHHGQAHQGGLHALLCALACQANLAVSLVASVPDIQHVLLFLGILVASFYSDRVSPPHGIRARAPPFLIPVC